VARGKNKNMKRKNSTSNIVLAIILLVTSIISLLVLFGTYVSLLFIPILYSLKQIAFSKWDYSFWAMAWTMLHCYMIVLSIEWLREKSVKHDMINTLALFLIIGVWGIIRASQIGVTEILLFVFYLPVLYYLHKTPAEKLST
jgi:hypothetical protein